MFLLFLEAQWKTFNQKSFVQYNLTGTLPQTYNRIQILFVPTQINQGYLTYAGLYPPQTGQTYLGVDVIIKFFLSLCTIFLHFTFI